MEVGRHRHISYLLLPCRQILGNLTAVIRSVTRAFTAEPLALTRVSLVLPFPSKMAGRKGKTFRGGWNWHHPTTTTTATTKTTILASLSPLPKFLEGCVLDFSDLEYGQTP